MRPSPWRSTAPTCGGFPHCICRRASSSRPPNASRHFAADSCSPALSTASVWSSGFSPPATFPSPEFACVAGERFHERSRNARPHTLPPQQKACANPADEPAKGWRRQGRSGRRARHRQFESEACGYRQGRCDMTKRHAAGGVVIVAAAVAWPGRYWRRHRPGKIIRADFAMRDWSPMSWHSFCSPRPRQPSLMCEQSGTTTIAGGIRPGDEPDYLISICWPAEYKLTGRLRRATGPARHSNHDRRRRHRLQRHDDDRQKSGGSGRLMDSWPLNQIMFTVMNGTIVEFAGVSIGTTSATGRSSRTCECWTMAASAWRSE